MIKKQLEISIPKKDEKQVVLLEIDHKESLLLRKWLANCERLEKAALLNRPFPVLKQLKFTAEKGFAFEVTEFPVNEMHELLHLARPLFLSKEYASFEKTISVFGRKAKGKLLARYLKKLRNIYRDGHYKTYFQFSVDGNKIFDESYLKLWLNGVEYHQDSDKEAVIAELLQVFSEAELRALFAVQVSGRIDACFQLCDFVREVLKPGTNNEFNADASNAGAG